MSRRVSTCRRVITTVQPQASNTHWITDDHLQFAFQRWLGTSTIASRRCASNVPGPLEARRRLARRQMGLTAPAGGIDFGLSDIFGWWRSGQDAQDNWRWEAPMTRPVEAETEAVEDGKTNTVQVTDAVPLPQASDEASLTTNPVLSSTVLPASDEQGTTSEALTGPEGDRFRTQFAVDLQACQTYEQLRALCEKQKYLCGRTSWFAFQRLLEIDPLSPHVIEFLDDTSTHEGKPIALNAYQAFNITHLIRHWATSLSQSQLGYSLAHRLEMLNSLVNLVEKQYLAQALGFKAFRTFLIWLPQAIEALGIPRQDRPQLCVKYYRQFMLAFKDHYSLGKYDIMYQKQILLAMYAFQNKYCANQRMGDTVVDDLLRSAAGETELTSLFHKDNARYIFLHLPRYISQQLISQTLDRFIELREQGRGVSETLFLAMKDFRYSLKWTFQKDAEIDRSLLIALDMLILSVVPHTLTVRTARKLESWLDLVRSILSRARSEVQTTSSSVTDLSPNSERFLEVLPPAYVSFSRVGNLEVSLTTVLDSLVISLNHAPHSRDELGRQILDWLVREYPEYTPRFLASLSRHGVQLDQEVIVEAVYDLVDDNLEAAIRVWFSVKDVPLSACPILPVKLIEKLAANFNSIMTLLLRAHPRKKNVNTFTSSWIDMIEALAVTFARSKHISSRQSYRNVHRLHQYLMKRGDKPTEEMTKALVHAGLIRWLAQGRWADDERVEWIDSVVRKTMGAEAANAIAKFIDRWRRVNAAKYAAAKGQDPGMDIDEKFSHPFGWEIYENVNEVDGGEQEATLIDSPWNVEPPPLVPPRAWGTTFKQIDRDREGQDAFGTFCSPPRRNAQVPMSRADDAFADLESLGGQLTAPVKPRAGKAEPTRPVARLDDREAVDSASPRKTHRFKAPEISEEDAFAEIEALGGQLVAPVKTRTEGATSTQPGTGLEQREAVVSSSTKKSQQSEKSDENAFAEIKALGGQLVAPVSTRTGRATSIQPGVGLDDQEAVALLLSKKRGRPRLTQMNEGDAFAEIEALGGQMVVPAGKKAAVAA